MRRDGAHARILGGAPDCGRSSRPPAGCGRRPIRAAGRQASSGCGIRPTTLPAALVTPAIDVDRPVGVAPVAQHHRPRASRSASSPGYAKKRRRGASSGSTGRRRPRGRQPRRLPLDAHPGSSGGENCRWALGRSTPGSRPASVSTWKPLQMPSTGPPASARRAHRRHRSARGRRWRRSAGGRRSEKPPGRMTAVGAAGRSSSACQTRTGSAPTSSTARSASRRRSEPGKAQTATRGLTRARLVRG